MWFCGLYWVALPALLGGFSCVFFLMTVSGLRVFKEVFCRDFDTSKTGVFTPWFL
nr:MAG TPA: hypothetical protein [Caudoviricetes sp.]